MRARCTSVIGRRRNVLRVPVECVEGSGIEATVQIVTSAVKAGKPAETRAPRRVRVGLRGDSAVEILDGLREGERVSPGAYHGPKRKTLDIKMD